MSAEGSGQSGGPGDTPPVAGAAAPRLKGERGTYYSRKTHKLAVRAKGPMREARKLTTAMVRDELVLDDESLELLKAMSRGQLPRNAASAMAAIKTRLEYSQPKPTQQVEHSGGLSIEIVKYGGDDDAG